VHLYNRSNTPFPYICCTPFPSTMDSGTEVRVMRVYGLRLITYLPFSSELD
jgi:hypothetical protein